MDADASAPDLPADGVSSGPIADDGAVDIRAVALRLFAGVATLMLLVGVLGYFFKEPLIDFSSTFVDTFGGPGILVAWFFADMLPLPIPHEAFTAFGYFGGMPFWTVVMWASIGSVTGATAGFSIGRHLSHTRWYERIMEKRGPGIRAFAKRYGLLALALGATTPLMYSVVCWACGAMNIEYKKFFLVTLLRIPRTALYLWLISKGLMSVT